MPQLPWLTESGCNATCDTEALGTTAWKAVLPGDWGADEHSAGERIAGTISVRDGRAFTCVIECAHTHLAQFRHDFSGVL